MTRCIPCGLEMNCLFQEELASVATSQEEHPISIADFGVPEKRLAFYIDGAAFRVGERFRRDRWIRERLRKGEPPWTIVELRARELKDVVIKIRVLVE